MSVFTVIIPCYKVEPSTTLDLIKKIPKYVTNIIVVDDRCPDEIGNYLFKKCKDKRLTIIFNLMNRGVGGAVLSGYKLALSLESKIIIKVDGDGQMNPLDIKQLIKPLILGNADYCKGNRFSNINIVKKMPIFRLIGNFFMSLIAKFATGYWNIFDFSNGFTAIKGDILKEIFKEKIHERFFFETDILYHLYIIKAKVLDVNVNAVYGDEISNINIWNELKYFPTMLIKRFFQRVFLIYFVLEVSLISFVLLLGLFTFFCGISVGLYSWNYYSGIGIYTPNSIIMFVLLNLLVGIFFIFYFFIEDTKLVPKFPRSTIHLDSKLITYLT